MKTISTAEFNQWLVHGYPGSQIVYHQGHLAYDREGMVNLKHEGRHLHDHFVHQFFEPQHTLGAEVYRAAQQGRVWLFQRRLDKNVFDYIAQKRLRPIRVARRILS